MTRNSNFTFNWVLIRELAIGTAPKNQDHLTTLKDNGIKSILSLCDISEAKPPEEINIFFNCERIVLPDHRIGRSLQVDEIIQTLIILKRLREYGPVFVHCVAGMERSPLICIAWLIKYKALTQQQAIDYLMQIHSNTNPLSSQLAVLRDKKFIEFSLP